MERYNIYHRKDGRWEGRIYKGKSKTGKRKYKYIFGKSKEQVQKKIREFRNKEIIKIKDYNLIRYIGNLNQGKRVKNWKLIIC